MDELLDELDVSYQDLYKLHTGHNLSEESGDSDQDSTISSRSTLDQLKPPLYCYKEIQRNLVIIDANTKGSAPEQSSQCVENQFGHSGSLKKDNTETLYARSLDLATCLTDSITPTYCHVCKKQADSGHYDYGNHYRKVLKWLRIELLKRDLPECNLKFYFCEICNLPLSGREAAQNHYEDSQHQANATRSCLQCFQKITRTSMTEHLKKHVSDIDNEKLVIEQVSKETDESFCNEDLMEDIALDSQTNCIQVPSSDNNPVDDTQHPYYKDSEKQHFGHLVNEGYEKENKQVKIQDYSPLTRYILSLLSPTFCYICNVPALDHYKTAYHNKTFFKWIFNNKHMLELFNIEYVESLMCFACREIFLNSEYVGAHYASEEHKEKAKYYCNLCMIHDYDFKNHMGHNPAIIQEEPLDISHGSAGYKKTPLFENERSKNENDITNDPAKIISTKLILMRTPIYCYICQKCVSVHGFANHYLERGHIIIVRKWLAVEIQKYGINIDPNLIYCEACNLELFGTNVAASHYQMAFHIQNQQMYCPVCVIRGPPNVIFQHYYSWQHQYNSEILTLLYHPNPFYSPTNVISQEKNSQLENAISIATTSNCCKICGVVFHTKNEADIHYSSRSHSISVNTWVQQNKMNVDTRVNSESVSPLSERSLRTLHQNIQNPLGNSNQDLAQNPRCIQDHLIKLDASKDSIKCKDYLDLNVATKKLLTEKDILEQNINSQIPIIKLPVGKDKSTEEMELYKLVNIEVQSILNKVYCLKPIPLELSLLYLRKFNKELTHADEYSLVTENKELTIGIGEYIELFTKFNSLLLYERNICNTCSVNSLISSLFSTKREWYRGASITKFLLLQKNLLSYERDKLMATKSIGECQEHKLSNNFSVSRKLDIQPNNMHLGKTSWRCVIL